MKRTTRRQFAALAVATAAGNLVMSGIAVWRDGFLPRHRQFLQKSLNRSGAISVYRTVC